MRTKREIIRISLIIILLAVALFSGYKIFQYFYEGYSYEKLNDDIREEYYAENSGRTEGIENNSYDPNEDRFDRFMRLWGVNGDIVGWLRVPGTRIDYPVVQASNNDYYLRRNINKEWAIRGTVFMDYRSDSDAKELNTVIYGHNMKDGSMFGNLSKYKKLSFFEENPYIEYDTPKEHTNWQIFSAYIYKAEDDFFKATFKDKNEFSAYIRDCVNRSIYNTDVEVSDQDLILTLMTCTYEYDDARFVVHAKLVEN